MNAKGMNSALNAIHEEANRLLQSEMSPELREGLHLIISLARYKFDVRSQPERERTRGTSSGRKSRKTEQADMLAWYQKMNEAYENLLTDDDRRELHAWEKEHVLGDGEQATSDWPGWVRFIGTLPRTT